MAFYTCQPCMVCKQRSVLELDQDLIDKLKDPNRPTIQSIVPDMDADQRELLISGTHPECWDKMFEGMDDA
jgi:hypothetical protein